MRKKLNWIECRVKYCGKEEGGGDKKILINSEETFRKIYWSRYKWGKTNRMKGEFVNIGSSSGSFNQSDILRDKPFVVNP